MPRADLDRGKTYPNSHDKLRLAQLRRGNEDEYDENDERANDVHEVDEDIEKER